MPPEESWFVDNDDRFFQSNLPFILIMTRFFCITRARLYQATHFATSVINVFSVGRHVWRKLFASKKLKLSRLGMERHRFKSTSSAPACLVARLNLNENETFEGTNTEYFLKV